MSINGHFLFISPKLQRPATFIKLNLTSTSIWHRNQTYPVLLQLLKTVTEYPIGWSDFSRKKFGHFSCCARMFQDPKTQISLWNVLFYLVQCLSYPKITNFFKKRVWSLCQEGGMSSLTLWKVKNDETRIFFLWSKSKTNLHILVAQYKCFNILISNFSFSKSSLKKKEGIWK